MLFLNAKDSRYASFIPAQKFLVCQPRYTACSLFGSFPKLGCCALAHEGVNYLFNDCSLEFRIENRTDQMCPIISEGIAGLVDKNSENCLYALEDFLREIMHS